MGQLKRSYFPTPPLSPSATPPRYNDTPQTSQQQEHTQRIELPEVKYKGLFGSPKLDPRIGMGFIDSDCLQVSDSHSHSKLEWKWANPFMANRALYPELRLIPTSTSKTLSQTSLPSLP